MRKSTIIATCLVNSGTVTDLMDGEVVVRSTFRDAFPEENCSDWNGDVDDDAARSIISRVGTAPAGVNVLALIEDLRELPAH